MANLKQFNATPASNGIAITATYDDGTTLQFPTDKESADFMISVVKELAAASDRAIAAENRAAAANRTADRARMRTGDRETEMPTKVDAQFMRMVRAVCPRYDEADQDDDPRLVALDVLRYAPVDAYSAVCSQALSELQLNQSIQILEQVDDYMKANDVQPKPYDARDSIKQIADGAAKFWGRKK